MRNHAQVRRCGRRASIYLDPEERSVGETSQAVGEGRKRLGANKHRYDLATERARAGR